MPSPTVSVVIPTYREEEYLDRCLMYMSQQTFYKRSPGDFEVVICDYDPDSTGETRFSMRERAHEMNVRYVRCDDKGIPYARHFGIMQSSGRFIINFDADDRFNRDDAIDIIVGQLDSGSTKLVWTETDYEGVTWYGAANQVYMALCNVMCIERASGMALCRCTYFDVGGFDINLKQQEDWALSSAVVRRYGMASRVKANGVKIIADPRRLEHVLSIDGVSNFLSGTSYDFAIR